MSVVAVGLNHRSAPLDMLERVAVLPEWLPKALHDLRARDHVAEAVVLSTCNRTEVYAFASRYHGAMLDLRNFLAEWSGVAPDEIADDLYSFYDEGVATHLFQVASGVDSAVLGEGEVLRQVRASWEAARVERVCGPVLDRLFRHAVETGKRVRAETAITRGITSLPHAAVVMAEEHLGGLAGRAALIVGAGEMGTALSDALGEAGGLAGLVVANRSWARAARVAARVGGRAAGWEALPAAVAAADVVFTCTGSPGVVLEAATLEAAVAGREGRPVLLVDMAVPRDVDPAVGEIPGVTLLDMDHLDAFAAAAVEHRRAELPAAERIVAEEVLRWTDANVAREVAPLVAAFRDRAEQLRRAELERHAADPEVAAAADAITRSVLAKLLHEPTVRLKDSAGTPQGAQLAAALRHLFDL